MVLAVDIGNTNICIGGLDGEGHRTVRFTARMVTRPRCTADEYAAELKFLLDRLQVDCAACEGVVVCSVVPVLTQPLADACRRLVGKPALIVSCELDTGLIFRVDAPEQVGRDRIADAAAAAALYPLPCMTVDLGTATTYNVLSAQREFLGGFIVPGVLTSLRAISRDRPAAPHRPGSSAGTDRPQYRGSTEQRRHVRHSRHAGRPGRPGGSPTGRAADRGSHRRAGPAHHALLPAPGALRRRLAVQGVSAAVGAQRPGLRQFPIHRFPACGGASALCRRSFLVFCFLCRRTQDIPLCAFTLCFL